MIISTGEVTGEDTESGYTEQACHYAQGLDSHRHVGHRLKVSLTYKVKWKDCWK